MKILWRWIPNYVGLYKISDSGRVKSVDRIVQHPSKGPRNRKGSELKQSNNSPNSNRGRLQVKLYKNGKGSIQYVHRLVWLAFRGPIPAGLELDHVDRKPLAPKGNRLSNLRLSTHQQNLCNASMHKRCKSGYKGVWKNPQYRGRKHNKWYWQVKKDGKPVAFGKAPTAKAAALLYDRAAKKHHGRFAALNFPI